MSSNRIAVISAQTGDRDALREDHVTTGADFIAFVEKPFDSRVWEQRPVCRNFRSHRRNSRMHKILIHQYVNAEYSLWMDANVALRVPAEQLIDEWLRDHDIAMFKHRIRDCIYDEADVCAKLELDDPRLIREQRDTYRQRGFPRNAGLGEASVILRRHTREIRNFNNAWWAEYCRFSVRDQISGMVAAHETSTAIHLVTPTKFDHPYFQISPRPPGVEPKANYENLN